MRSASYALWLALLAAAMPTASALPATISGVDYAVQYDWQEFYSVAYNKSFRVVLLGNGFPQMSPDESAGRLLPILQASKPRVPLTFTYDTPAEPQRPDYRLVLVFNPANDLGADPVCRGGKRFRDARPGEVYVFAVYCRNDQAMSQGVGRATAAGPDDPRVADLLRDLLRSVFDDGYLARRKGTRRMP